MKGASSATTSKESTRALRHFFAWLESNYGGLVFDPSPKIIQSSGPSSLLAADLLALMRHDVTAIHVKGFYPKTAAIRLGRQLALESETKRRVWKVSTSRGLESSDVSTLGEHAPFNVASAMGKEEEYFQGVGREFYKRRFEMSDNRGGDDDNDNDDNKLPTLWPLDLLRLSLDEVWPWGAGLARTTTASSKEKDPSKQLPFSAGLPRIMQGPSRWRQGFIHVDELGPLDVSRGLFSANIYLQLPEPEDKPTNQQQTEAESSNIPQDILHIWPMAIKSRWDWYRNALSLSGLSSQDVEDQMRLRKVLGEPMTIACEPGDLVLLCAQRPHAAVGFSNGTRVSLQCFIQHQGADKRLLIDT
mmetsp:Transcript_7587/g.19175  ORF Transcript_7587/g.19175 Transcript_7587/m.19175 type:complete len:359 (+) Transcript_7587:36-1112(+)